jgi:uncharacterized coiled-coil DUF342 family protein
MNFIHQIRTRNLHQTTYFTTAQFQEINETISVLSNGVEALSEDIKRLGIESVQCQNELKRILQNLPTLKKSIDEDNAFVDSMKPNQENVERDILSMKQQFDEMRSMSFDGTYIWKITNVQEKMG